MTTLRTLKCNHCDWQGDEDTLLHETDARDPEIVTEYCPRCLLGDALMDIPESV